MKKILILFMLISNFVVSQEEEFKPMFDLENIKPVSIKIESGEDRNCFIGRWVDIDEFKLIDSTFVLGKDKESFRDKESYKLDSINKLLLNLEKNRYKKLRITDFSFTKNDIKKFKWLIKDIKRDYKSEELYYIDFIDLPFEEIDYKFFLKSVDSLDLYDEIVNEVFDTEEDLNPDLWLQIKIKFNDESELSILNVNYDKGYLQLPWFIEYKGKKFKVNSLEFGNVMFEKFSEYYNVIVFPKKEFAIFEIINYLYKESLPKSTLKKN